METLVEQHLARLRVVLLDQRPGIIEQDLLRQAAKVPEGALQPLEPGHLALVAEGPGVDPPRIAQRGHEQVGPHALLADPDLPLAEIDLQLPTRWRLKTHGGQSLGQQLSPQVGYSAFHRPQADPDAVFGRQFLAQDVGVAAVSPEPLRHPVLKT